MIHRFTIPTGKRTDFIDITREIASAITRSGVTEGLCQVFIPHTTAGVTINEDADPDVVHDITTILDRMVPWQAGYHHTEGNSAAHVKASLMGSSVMVPVSASAPVLGTWQGIYLCEFDGPRTRTVVVTVLGS